MLSLIKRLFLKFLFFNMLKDYTTKKRPEETIGEIQNLLKDFGVRSVLSDYDDTGNITSMSFEINIDGRFISFRLPTDWRPVLEFMKQDDTPGSFCNEDQARRTAWRQVYHWIDAQLALVRVNMVTFKTVFLPYAVGKDGRTLAQVFDDNPQLLLQ